jgi:hypothetical protein
VTGPIPTEIGNLKQLRELYDNFCSCSFNSEFHDVPLEGTIPTEMGNMDSLVHMCVGWRVVGIGSQEREREGKLRGRGRKRRVKQNGSGG